VLLLVLTSQESLKAPRTKTPTCLIASHQNNRKVLYYCSKLGQKGQSSVTQVCSWGHGRRRRCKHANAALHCSFDSIMQLLALRRTDKSALGRSKKLGVTAAKLSSPPATSGARAEALGGTIHQVPKERPDPKPDVRIRPGSLRCG